MGGKKVLVFGYFGYKTRQMDGQTIKTRQLYDLLENRLGSEFSLSFFDTEVLQTRPWAIIRLLFSLPFCSKVVYLPAHNNLSRFLPVLENFSRIFHFDILYVLIGGWLPDFIQTHPYLLKHLKRLKAVFPENQFIVDRLRNEYGISQAQVLPNFRKIQAVKKTRKPCQDGIFRLVFMSRIVMEKGIDTVFKLAGYFLKEDISGDVKVEIDFYGKVYDKDAAFFKQQIRENPNVRYYGELEPEKISGILSQYDALILPTRYTTEGFPGAILDAYIAGIPVLVSNWRYASEYVKEGVTGFIVPIGDDEVERYASHIMEMSTHPDMLSEMCGKASLEAGKYTEDKVWSIIRPFLMNG